MPDTEIWDFSSGISTKHMRILRLKTTKSFAFCNCYVSACSGIRVGTAQPCLLLHEGPPITIRRKVAKRDYYFKVRAGQTHLSNSVTVSNLSWSSSHKLFVMAMKNEIIEKSVKPVLGESAIHHPSLLAIQNNWILTLLNYIRVSLSEPKHCDSACLEFIATSLAIKIFEMFGKNDYSMATISGGLGSVREKIVRRYITDNILNEIRLHDLATSVNLSTDYFGRAFKKSFGIPPWRFIRERRINLAKEMLMEIDVPITKIAIDLQFSSHSHFTTAFYELTGTTPSTFRRSILRKN
ncbi:helix-turn-helix domain-containing protein [Thalassospira xiamenensis]|jgi:AraC-like DNA-binding protein|uniref:helix-turn-helix domain-containing protein n=1 Tax=Thalassospira xiamenensis TaxID=220697 RepID=UPI000E9E038D|nr:AraC family transcriptional regulator [Thalassospira xiamenensis]HBN50765.1 hypothetical protein [Thalassospira sp.]|tara:strand:+ start:76 stop:960 length:885 start_codon:yes stop_codon:yes gene_type:complete